jgi:prepilin-type N-terminal cleavage/methylation domain-containing protein
MKRKQSGFTLIEIAIVLVIIGLLLGGVLKGQELINSAKVKNMATDFKNIPVFIYGYQDKFKALPGDDKCAFTSATCTVPHLTASGTPLANSGGNGNGNGDGVLNGKWADTQANPTSEAYNFWYMVRLSGLAPGSTDVTSADWRPTNAAGGTIGIQGGNTPSIIGMRGTYVICSSGILGKFVKQLDTTMDDGNPTTGSMLATKSIVDGVTAVLPDAVSSSTDEASAYTVCMGV